MTTTPVGEYASRPLSGRMSLPGFDAAVEIHTDAAGVPSVFSQSRADMYRAQGFLHMSERAWQIDVESRTGLGQLSALLGPGALMSDALFTRLGFHEIAKSVVDEADPEVKQVFDWYAMGMSVARIAVPTTFEHNFVGAEVPLLTGEQAHLQAVAIMLSLGFSLQHDWLLGLLKQSIEIENRSDSDEDAPSPIDLLTHINRNLPGGVGTSAGWGSNAWAVQRPNAAPVLCGDPHLDDRMPGHWMPMRLSSPLGDVVGASLPGLPDIFFGHNGHVGWATTFAPVTTTRLVIERLTRDGRRVSRPTGEIDVVSSSKRIDVKGFGEEAVICGRTDRGRLLGLDIPGNGGQWKYDLAIDSSQWLDPYSQRSLARASSARTIHDLALALRDWRSVPQSIVCADTSGAIGVIQTGFHVSGVDVGHLARGWELKGAGDLKVEDRHQLRLCKGIAVAANHRSEESVEHGQWEAPLRAGRIADLIASSGSFNVSQMAKIQLDIRSSLADLLLDEALVRIQTSLGPELEPFADALRAWDRLIFPDAVEPLIFAHWMAEIARSTVQSAGPVVADLFITSKAWLTEWGLDIVEQRIMQNSPQLQDIGLIAALSKALENIRVEQGQDVQAWSWGRRHNLGPKHPFGRMFPHGNLPKSEPMPGSDDSICRGDFNSPPSIAASFRVIVDLNDLNDSVWSFPYGVSGVLGSPHFQDQVSSWRAGQYHSIPWSQPARGRFSHSSLFINPIP